MRPIAMRLLLWGVRCHAGVTKSRCQSAAAVIAAARRGTSRYPAVRVPVAPLRCSGRGAELEELAVPIVVEFASLLHARQAQRDKAVRDLVRGFHRRRILARERLCAHAGTDRSRREQIDANI